MKYRIIETTEKQRRFKTVRKERRFNNERLFSVKGIE